MFVDGKAGAHHLGVLTVWLLKLSRAFLRVRHDFHCEFFARGTDFPVGGLPGGKKCFVVAVLKNGVILFRWKLGDLG